MISFRLNRAEFVRQLARQRRREALAAVSALNATAYDIVRKDLPRTMARVFDRPTRFTLNAFRYDKATLAEPVASVVYRYGGKGARFGRRHYLVTQVEGGQRPPKAVETKLANRARALGAAGFPARLYPTAAVPRDRYGNVRTGFWNRVLSDVQAQTEQGYGANRTAASLKRNRNYRAQRFFIAGVGRSRHLAPGVWMRRGNRIAPVLLGADHVDYARRFPFWQVAERAVRRRFPLYLARARARMTRAGAARAAA